MGGGCGVAVVFVVCVGGGSSTKVLLFAFFVACSLLLPLSLPSCGFSAPPPALPARVFVSPAGAAPGAVPRDQGFTRPKVLLLLPMRNAAYQVVKRLVALAQKETRADSVQVCWGWRCAFLGGMEGGWGSKPLRTHMRGCWGLAL